MQNTVDMDDAVKPRERGRLDAPLVTRENAATEGARRARSRQGGAARTVERRTVRKIRFTAAEWMLVEERARTCGRAPARYVREVALGAVPKVSRTRANAPAIRELGTLAAMVQRIQRTLSARDVAVQVPATAARFTGTDVADDDVVTELDAVVAGLLAVVRRLG